jgi:hypothetical protein
LALHRCPFSKASPDLDNADPGVCVLDLESVIDSFDTTTPVIIFIHTHHILSVSVSETGF